MSEQQEANVDRLRELLTEAVQCLESSSAGSSNVLGPSQQTPRSARRDPPRNGTDACRTSVLGGRGSSTAGPPSRSRETANSVLGRFAASNMTSSSALVERNSLFHYGAVGGRAKSRKRKLALWTRDFYCLASTTQSRLPTPLEKSQLLSAGKKCGSMLNAANKVFCITFC